MPTLITAVLVHNLGMCLFDQRQHHSQRRQIHRPKKAALIMTYADNSPEKEGVIINHYNVLLNYLGWQDAGKIIAPGVWPAGAVNHTDYPRQAYELGKSLSK